MLDLYARMQRWRYPLLALLDGFAWFIAFAVTVFISQFSSVELAGDVRNALIAGVMCGLAHIVVARLVRLHEGRSLVGSFDEAVLLSAIVISIGVVALVIDVSFGAFYRGIVAVAAPAYALIIMILGRGMVRLVRDRALRERGAALQQARRAVVVGAGDAALQLVKSMIYDVDSPYKPVALLDDDPFKRHRRIEGVPVRGQIKDLARVAQARGAEVAVVAIPTADGKLLRRIDREARKINIDLKTLPSLTDLVDPQGINISDVRDIDVAELLGRRPIQTDVDSIAQYITGKRVLVTGAGGSIGSELSRQLYQYGPAELMMLDRDESALHAVELSIHGRATLDTPETVLANIRDERALLRIFHERRPEVVFHAAALKHLPLLEKAPGEAVRTNVWGTYNVLKAAAEVGVTHFVNVSTDKAANPTSVLGYTKRLAEGLTASFAHKFPGTYLSVRFGNVLGSRGSVLTTFAKQISNGGPVTVTHPDITRYFMTIREAVQLVIQAGAIGDDGEVLVLDMGEPVSIDAVARRLIEQSGNNVEIVYTGLRQGEKMHEILIGAGENDQRPKHELISHVHAPTYAPVDAHSLQPWDEPADVIKRLEADCARMLAGADEQTAGSKMQVRA